MGASLYYRAVRTAPLTAAERADVAAAIERYPLEDLLMALGLADEFDYRGERFSHWKSTRSDVVFDGSTRIPASDAQTLRPRILKHWCGLLAEIRRILPGAAWRVHVEDADLAWDEAKQAYVLPA